MSQKRDEVIRTVLDTKIIAIIRGFPPETCVRLAEAYLKGGIRMVEVTFPQADPASWTKTAEAIRPVSSRRQTSVLVPPPSHPQYSMLSLPPVFDGPGNSSV